MNYKRKNRYKRNSPKVIRRKNKIEALKDLNLRDEIIITKADKGGAVLIIDVENYISEVN